jgi:putative ABC transport system permease protein
MPLYNALLHLYPASFRNEYGKELRALFARKRRDASRLGVIAVWLGAIADVAGNAALVHWDLLRQDLGYTLRMLRRAPGFATTAVLIVALGIGATTAAFSVTDFVLLRPLPFPEPDRLVQLFERNNAYGRMELSAANYRDWKQGSTVFESLGLHHQAAGNLLTRGEPMRVIGTAVSADLLPTLRARPLMGRLFSDRDDQAGAPGTILLSYRLWQTQFGADEAILGQQVQLDAESYTVIGVMPPAFRFPSPDTQFWTTVRFTEQAYADRGDNWHYGVGRLRRGVTFEQAQAEMDVLAARSKQQYPVENKSVGAILYHLNDDVSQQSRLLLYALSGAAACVLLIACANLANLLLARALGRRRELAVRTAMGAGRERMVRQLMTESLLLASVGGVIGVAIAYVGVPLLNTLVPSSLPLASDPTVDLRVLLFAIALTLVTGAVFGLAPILRLGGEADLGGLHESSRSGGGQREGVRSALVVVEIVASVVLLVSAGLLMRALWAVQATDPGFRAESVLTLQTPLPLPQFGRVTTREAFYARVGGDIRALPGVTDAAFVSYLPMGKMRGGIWPVSFDGRAVNRADDQNAFLRYVTPGYFRTLGVPLRSGRDITDADTKDRPYVAVVSESFVKKYWPAETRTSVLGRHFTFAFSDRTVVGVVGDIRMRGLERDAEPQVYLSSRQVDDDAVIGYIPRGLVVRSTVPPETLAASIRAIVHRVDPTLPVTDVSALTEIVERDTASRAAQLRVLGAFAVIAFVLAGIGIHGLLSFAVSQREQEIGVRMALGAQAGDIFSMIMWRSAMLAAAGIIPGVLMAYWAGLEMRALLAGVRPGDPATFGAAIVLATAMTLVGSLMPTLRALRVDPITAIRTE